MRPDWPSSLRQKSPRGGWNRKRWFRRTKQRIALCVFLTSHWLRISPGPRAEASPRVVAGSEDSSKGWGGEEGANKSSRPTRCSVMFVVSGWWWIVEQVPLSTVNPASGSWRLVETVIGMHRLHSLHRHGGITAVAEEERRWRKWKAHAGMLFLLSTVAWYSGPGSVSTHASASHRIACPAAQPQSGILRLRQTCQLYRIIHSEFNDKREMKHNSLNKHNKNTLNTRQIGLQG